MSKDSGSGSTTPPKFKRGGWTDFTIQRLALALLEVRKTGHRSQRQEFEMIQELAIPIEDRKSRNNNLHWMPRILEKYKAVEAAYLQTLQNKAHSIGPNQTLAPLSPLPVFPGQLPSYGLSGIGNNAVIAGEVYPTFNPNPLGLDDIAHKVKSELTELNRTVSLLGMQNAEILKKLDELTSSLTSVAKRVNQIPVDTPTVMSNMTRALTGEPIIPNPIPVTGVDTPQPVKVSPPPRKLVALVYGMQVMLTRKDHSELDAKLPGFELQWLMDPSGDFGLRCSSVDVIFYSKKLMSSTVLAQMKAENTSVIGIRDSIEHLVTAATQYQKDYFGYANMGDQGNQLASKSTPGMSA